MLAATRSINVPPIDLEESNNVFFDELLSQVVDDRAAMLVFIPI